MVTVNRNEEVTISLYSGADDDSSPTNLLGSTQVKLDERGYHLVDSNTPIPLDSDRDFLVSLEFAYQDQEEPLVYCVDASMPATDSYVLNYSATNPTPTWTAMTNIAPHGGIFAQAVWERP